jgi:hypothetical protein
MILKWRMLFNQNKDTAIPPMRMTPSQFVEFAWSMDFVVISADSARLDANFIDEVTLRAEQQGVEVQYLDFAQYSNAVEAITAKENAPFLNALEDGTKPRLLWFDNCESLAALDVNLTYSIRSVLTTRSNGMVQSVFITRKEALQLLFCDKQAAFYQSNTSITDP